MDNYFGMDSFNRNAFCCCNEISSRVSPRVATKCLNLGDSADELLVDNESIGNAFKEIYKRLNKNKLEKVSSISSAFVAGRLKRADLNLVFR